MPEEKRPKDNSAYMQEAFERAGRCKSAKTALGAIVCGRERGFAPVDECCPKVKGEPCIFYEESERR